MALIANYKRFEEIRERVRRQMNSRHKNGVKKSDTFNYNIDYSKLKLDKNSL